MCNNQQKLETWLLSSQKFAQSSWKIFNIKLQKCLRLKVVAKIGKMVWRKRFPAQDTQKLLICLEADPLKIMRNLMLKRISKTSTKKFMIGWLCYLLLKFCFCCSLELFIMIFTSYAIIWLSNEPQISLRQLLMMTKLKWQRVCVYVYFIDIH